MTLKGIDDIDRPYIREVRPLEEEPAPSRLPPKPVFRPQNPSVLSRLSRLRLPGGRFVQAVQRAMPPQRQSSTGPGPRHISPLDALTGRGAASGFDVIYGRRKSPPPGATTGTTAVRPIPSAPPFPPKPKKKMPALDLDGLTGSGGLY